MFRFSIRDVVWLTVVVAFAVAWWMQRQDALALSAANKVQKANLIDVTTRLETLRSNRR